MRSENDTNYTNIKLYKLNKTLQQHEQKSYNTYINQCLPASEKRDDFQRNNVISRYREQDVLGTLQCAQFRALKSSQTDCFRTIH
jgi:hypothetical protein